MTIHYYRKPYFKCFDGCGQGAKQSDGVNMMAQSILCGLIIIVRSSSSREVSASTE